VSIVERLDGVTAAIEGKNVLLLSVARSYWRTLGNPQSRT
jgi:hypothetical protein